MRVTDLTANIVVALAIALTAIVFSPQASADDPVSQASPSVRVLFDRLDTSDDGRLTLGEFLQHSGEQEILRRDFRLFDLDDDASHTMVEFNAAAAFVASVPRGAIADPFNALVQNALEAIDESHDHWNLRPTELVNSRRFVTNFLKSISPDGTSSISGRVLQQADPNSDNLVSRTEARQFLQQQLGIRWYRPLLRRQTGRVANFARFLELDQNRNGSISGAEFAAKSDDDSTFSAHDHDADGRISVLDFVHEDGPNYRDPVAWFRRADTNWDASLDRQELQSASDQDRRHLVESTFSGFDDDGDDRLSLQEYRLSMHGNFNYSWETLPQDQNQDGRLSFDEFQFNDYEAFHLQRRLYFHRLDTDQNGTLSGDEFPFR